MGYDAAVLDGMPDRAGQPVIAAETTVWIDLDPMLSLRSISGCHRSPCLWRVGVNLKDG
jgi:hypothetical protein